MRKFFVWFFSLVGKDADAMKNQILHLHIEHQKAQKAIDDARIRLSKVKEQKLQQIGDLKRHTLEKTTAAVDKMHSKATAEEADIDQKYNEAKEKVAEKKRIANDLKCKAGDLAACSLEME